MEANTKGSYNRDHSLQHVVVEAYTNLDQRLFHNLHTLT